MAHPTPLSMALPLDKHEGSTFVALLVIRIGKIYFKQLVAINTPISYMTLTSIADKIPLGGAPYFSIQGAPCQYLGHEILQGQAWGL